MSTEVLNEFVNCVFFPNDMVQVNLVPMIIMTGTGATKVAAIQSPDSRTTAISNASARAVIFYDNDYKYMDDVLAFTTFILIF